jgi:hypothetical protein
MEKIKTIILGVITVLASIPLTIASAKVYESEQIIVSKK